MSCETLQEWNKKIYDILSDNGLFLPTGTTVKITDLTELPVLKNRIQTIDGDHPNIPKDVVFFQGRINNKSHYLFVGPPSRELVSKDFVQFLKEYFDQALNSEDIILITSSYSSKFLHRLQNLQKEFTSQKKNSNHPRLIFASLHPDLMVMGLDFKFHKESIKIVGNLHLNVEKTQFNYSFYNFQTEKEQQIDFTKIALWGLRPLKLKAPEVPFNQQRLEWMQLPFYSQYIHSQLKLDFCRGDNQKSIIERLKTRSTNVDLWEFCGYDFYGTQHYGFFSF